MYTTTIYILTLSRDDPKSHAHDSHVTYRCEHIFISFAMTVDKVIKSIPHAEVEDSNLFYTTEVLGRNSTAKVVLTRDIT